MHRLNDIQPSILIDWLVSFMKLATGFMKIMASPAAAHLVAGHLGLRRVLLDPRGELTKTETTSTRTGSSRAGS
jgi:hypothetical protein